MELENDLYKRVLTALSLLADGSFHPVEEIAEKAGLPPEQTRILLERGKTEGLVESRKRRLRPERVYRIRRI